MEQSEVQEIIRQSLHLLKEKIVVALESNDHDSVETEINELSKSIATMAFKLEELSFEAGRLQEEDNSFTFADFDDFQNS